MKYETTTVQMGSRDGDSSELRLIYVVTPTYTRPTQLPDLTRNLNIIVSLLLYFIGYILGRLIMTTFFSYQYQAALLKILGLLRNIYVLMFHIFINCFCDY